MKKQADRQLYRGNYIWGKSKDMDRKTELDKGTQDGQTQNKTDTEEMSQRKKERKKDMESRAFFHLSFHL